MATKHRARYVCPLLLALHLAHGSFAQEGSSSNFTLSGSASVVVSGGAQSETFAAEGMVEPSAAEIELQSESFTGAVGSLFVPLPGTVEVAIDIKPGSTENCFNLNDRGVIPVAILGSDAFDASLVDPASCSLLGLTVRIVGKSEKLLAHREDVNADGFVDLVLQIEDQDGSVAEGQATAVLTGVLEDGTPVQGSDVICVVP